jgi:hypothetical protein
MTDTQDNSVSPGAIADLQRQNEDIRKVLDMHVTLMQGMAEAIDRLTTAVEKLRERRGREDSIPTENIPSRSGRPATSGEFEKGEG